MDRQVTKTVLAAAMVVLATATSNLAMAADDLGNVVEVKTGEELYYTDIPAGYSQAGITVNEGFRLSGATLVTLTDDQGDFSLEHLYLNEREDGDFVRWEEY